MDARFAQKRLRKGAIKKSGASRCKEANGRRSAAGRRRVPRFILFLIGSYALSLGSAA